MYPQKYYYLRNPSSHEKSYFSPKKLPLLNLPSFLYYLTHIFFLEMHMSDVQFHFFKLNLVTTIKSYDVF